MKTDINKTILFRNPAIGNWIKYMVLLILGAAWLLPFYWMASSAVKNDQQVFVVPPVWLPNPPRWQNLAEAWGAQNFNLFLLNTIFKYAIPVTIATALSSAIVAYGFARIKWLGRDVFFAICLSTIMIPFQVTMVPLFIIFKKLGWINTFLPLVIPAFFGNPYFIFLLRQFFKGIPEELSDAARIDGANEFDIFWRIIMPLVRPALIAVALFAFMGAWNDYLGPLIYLHVPEQYTLSEGIQFLRINISAKTTRMALAYPYLMAVSTIITLPILAIFLFAQKSFVEGIATSGIKG
jgi:ABC-type glycerol-3-phosphate transport system permease component